MVKITEPDEGLQPEDFKTLQPRVRWDMCFTSMAAIRAEIKLVREWATKVEQCMDGEITPRPTEKHIAFVAQWAAFDVRRAINDLRKADAVANMDNRNLKKSGERPAYIPATSTQRHALSNQYAVWRKQDA